MGFAQDLIVEINYKSCHYCLLHFHHGPWESGLEDELLSVNLGLGK